MSAAAPLPPLAEELALLTEAAAEAGVIARRWWKRSPQVWDKGGALGPVTEADLAVDARLREVLLGARPDYGWLSEESEDGPARLDARRTFILDPIDGTRAFIEGQEGFSHALAVAEGGRVVAGVVFLPVPGTLYAATADGPATRNDEPIRPSAAQIDGARVLTAKASLDPRFWRGSQPPPVRRSFRSSLAWRLCLAAEGRFDAAFTLRPAWEWDVAAGALIAERAGAAVTDRHGRPPVFNSKRRTVEGLIAAGPALHAALLDRLDPDA